jgi:nucleoside-diphosphate-sugar epimerase
MTYPSTNLLFLTIAALLLSNFLSSLTLAQKIPKRFLLQTGAKHYGLHIGPPINPQEESNPRVKSSPNFYYPQEDLLWKWSAENNTEWNVTRPAFIIGAVRDAAMNLAYGFSLYAAIQKELGGSLEFPGDLDAWDVEKHQSNALLIGYHAEWAVLTPSARNQALNIADGGVFTYGQFWPVLAAVYDIPYKVPEADQSRYKTVEMPISPPPRGFGPAGKFRVSGSFEEWANKPEVKQAWETLKARHNIAPKPDPFDKIPEIFGLLDIDVLGNWGRSLR